MGTKISVDSEGRASIVGDCGKIWEGECSVDKKGEGTEIELNCNVQQVKECESVENPIKCPVTYVKPKKEVKKNPVEPSCPISVELIRKDNAKIVIESDQALVDHLLKT